MLQSVDQDLDRGIGMYLHPPPAFVARGGPHREDGPPPFEEGGLRHGEPPGGDRPEPEPPHNHGEPNGMRDGQEPHGEAGGNDRREDPPHRDGFPPRASGPDSQYRPHVWTARGTSEFVSDTRPVWDAAALARAQTGETLVTTATFDDEPLRVLSSPCFLHTGERGAVQIAYPLKEVYRAIAGINTALLLLIPVGLLGAGWAGVSLTNRVLRRVQGLTRAAARLGAEDLSQRLPTQGRDEFAALSETFNGLLSRLEGAFRLQQQTLEQQRRFTADASHELKTPLTIIKGRAGMALGRESTDERSRRAFMEIDAAAGTMSHLVQDLLLLARSDEGRLAQDRIEMLVCDLLASAGAQAACDNAAPISAHIEPPSLLVRGNEAELTRLFRNLLDNALLYTPPTGRVTVAAHAANGDVVVTISDTGEGIATRHLPHLGERFYRVDESRTRPTGGTGLGLSICRSIVHAHGGTLHFESVVGVGTTVTVTLPQSEG